MTRSFKELAGKSKEGLLPSHAESGPEIDFVHEEIRKDSLSRSYRGQKAIYIYLQVAVAYSFGWLHDRDFDRRSWVHCVCVCVCECICE